MFPSDGLNDRKDANVVSRGAHGALAALVLLITTACSLLLSYSRLMWADELLSYWGDRLPSAADVLRVQLHYPISLDPPTYHLLAHWSMQVFGQNAAGMRAPALLGVLIMQMAVFFLVRRLAGPRAALIAMALPAALGPFWYSAEGRPYGWLLGMYALALLCWFCASDARPATEGPENVTANYHRGRRWALPGLALAIAGAITSHYFGVLILVPLAAGELVRIVERRRIDWPMLAALALGTASLALILPFQHALKAYQGNYYNRHVTLEAVQLGYTNVVSQSVAATVLFLLVVAALGWLRFRKRPPTEPAYLWAALASLALMPVTCYLFERFVTHSMEGRYALPAVIALVVVLALALENSLRRNSVFYLALVTVLLAGIASNIIKIKRERRFRAELTSQFTPPPQAAALLAADSSKKIYLNSFGDFLQDQYYAPPDLKPRLSYVYDAGADVRWLGRDTHSISAVNVHQFAPLSVTPYGQFLQERRPLALLYHTEGWEWLGEDLGDRRIDTRPLGPLMLGHLVEVETPPDASASQRH